MCFIICFLEAYMWYRINFCSAFFVFFFDLVASSHALSFRLNYCVCVVSQQCRGAPLHACVVYAQNYSLFDSNYLCEKCQ